ncbi:NmrA/HSCARG family protein [Sorangium sp. So ce1099]|uniref:NmrA/HSCARG family protein n=1 Tax=Sorangium sp. So ce1099 TaxID=3133331 RepID=UPI003F616192
MSKDRTVLVTGASGRQGKQVVKHLLRTGFAVRALVRDRTTPAAEQLRSWGATLVEGTFEDRAALGAATRGAHGVFSMQNFWRAGYVAEFLQARNVLEAAIEAHVPHFVYSSAGIDRDAGLPNIETKAIIEAMTLDAFPHATILRPVWFMEGFGPDFFDLERNVFGYVTAPDRPHGWVSVEDIGRFVASALAAPDDYAGVRINLASSASTGEQMAEAFSRALGRRIVYEQWSEQKTEQVVRDFVPHAPYCHELRLIYDYIRDVNFTLDFAALDEKLPVRHTLESWVNTVAYPAWLRTLGPDGAARA